MRKIVSIFFIFTGSALLIISSSDRIMKTIAEKRSGMDGWFGIHRSNAGDLVSMSYLDSVKQFQKKYKENFERPPDDSGKRNIDLYIYGDSYLLSIPDSAFGYINSYHFGRRSYFDLDYSLDPHKKNILIIEIAERFVRTEFQLHQIYLHLKKKDPGSVFLRLSSHPAIYAGLPDIQFFSPDINRNLEFNLFGYRFWDQVKLAKASLTYDLFKRAVGDAVVSDDGSRLFLKQTTVMKDVLSSYYPFDQMELQGMISNINDVYDHYKAEGFDEIYLSIIPNPVTILQPINYNGLIPRLQNSDSLKGMRIIDMYGLFSRDPDPGRFYRIGDTHWSFDGIQVWLNEVNAELKKQSQDPAITSIRQTYDRIQADSNMKKLVLDGEDFLEQTPDGGASLTGYFSKNKLVKIVSWIGLSYGIRQTEFFYDGTGLIFCFVTESHFRETKTGLDYTATKPALSGRFYYQKEKLIGKKITGSGFWDKLDEENILPDSREYYKLLVKQMKK